MADQRIKGQESVILIQKDGELQDKIDTISDAEVEFQSNILNEAYLSEASERFDSIFVGMRIRATGHMANDAWLKLTEDLINKQQRRGPDIRVDMTTVLRFPNGLVIAILIPDLSFGSVPMNIGGREEYISFQFEAQASGFKIRR